MPNTPSILSDNRNSFFSIPHTGSSQNSSGPSPASSDANLRHLGEQPFTRQGRHHRRRSTTQPRSSNVNGQSQQDHDSEWLLRAGSAFSTSARKDKGQSWLIKRQSSTSLHLDAENQQAQVQSSSTAYQSRNASRGRSRSHASTPTNGRSRHGSRAAVDRRHLSMTPLHPMTQDEYDYDSRGVSDSRRTSISVWSAFESDHLDETGDGLVGARSSSGQEVEQISLKDLNRFRGFGLGSWLDRIVQSVIFGTWDEDPTNVPLERQTSGNHEQPFPVSRTASASTSDGNESDYTADETTGDGSDSEDDESVISPFEDDDIHKATLVQRPGQEGGYFSDINWLFQVAKSSLY